MVWYLTMVFLTHGDSIVCQVLYECDLITGAPEAFIQCFRCSGAEITPLQSIQKGRGLTHQISDYLHTIGPHLQYGTKYGHEGPWADTSDQCLSLLQSANAYKMGPNMVMGPWWLSQCEGTKCTMGHSIYYGPELLLYVLQ